MPADTIVCYASPLDRAFASVLYDQAVAEPGLREEMPRRERVGLELVAQLLHIDAQVMGIVGVRGTPNLGQKLPVRHGQARVLGERGDETEFDRREVHVPARARGAPALEI